MLGEAGEAGWGPVVVEGRGTAGQGTRALWRRTNPADPMKGSSSLSLRMTTGTESRGSLQVSPPVRTLWRQQSGGGGFINWSHLTNHILPHDNAALFKVAQRRSFKLYGTTLNSVATSGCTDVQYCRLMHGD